MFPGIEKGFITNKWDKELKTLINSNIKQDKLNNTLPRKIFYQKNKNQIQGKHSPLRSSMKRLK